MLGKKPIKWVQTGEINRDYSRISKNDCVNFDKLFTEELFLPIVTDTLETYLNKDAKWFFADLDPNDYDGNKWPLFSSVTGEFSIKEIVIWKQNGSLEFPYTGEIIVNLSGINRETLQKDNTYITIAITYEVSTLNNEKIVLSGNYPFVSVQFFL